MGYERISKLEVFRKLTDGTNVAVGTLAQNRQGVYFQYDASYLQQYHNLSPFNLACRGSSLNGTALSYFFNYKEEIF